MATDDLKFQMLKTPYGIDSMDAADKLQEETVRAANDELNRCYASCFSSAAGKKVLKHLRHCTIDQPTMIPDQVHYSYMREGQNSLVREMIRRIESITKPSKS